MIYHFTITTEPNPNLDPHAPDFEDKFHRAGCNDATIVYQGGYIKLMFAREAPSRDAAVESALAAVKRAGGDWIALNDRHQGEQQ